MQTPSNLLLLLPLTLLMACGSPDKPRPDPVAVIRPRQKAAQLPSDGPPPVEDWDHWVRELNEFMSAAEMREHLALPEGQRLKVRHRRLMDLTLRKDLLDSIRDLMTVREIEIFRALSTYQECEEMARRIRARRG